MGWNRPKERRGKREEGRGGQRNVHLKGLVAGAIVVVGAAVAAWWIFGGKPAPVREGADGTVGRLIKEVKPAAGGGEVPRPQEEKRAEPAKPSMEKDKDGYYHFVDADGIERRTKSRLVMAALLSDKPGVQAPHLAPDPNVPSRYRNDLQCELAQFMRPGRAVDISQHYSNKEALRMATESLEYAFDDPETVLNEKKFVEDTCRELVDYIKNGGQADDFLARLCARQDMEREAIQTTRSEVLKLCREGKREDAEAALAAYNKYLGEKGIPPMKMEHQMERALRLGKQERGEQ